MRPRSMTRRLTAHRGRFACRSTSMSRLMPSCWSTSACRSPKSSSTRTSKRRPRAEFSERPGSHLMSNTARILASLLATSAVLWPVAQAHHSFAAEFDQQKVVHLEGVVVRFAWVNPHSWIYLDVSRPDGTVEQWKVEG